MAPLIGTLVFIVALALIVFFLKEIIFHGGTSKPRLDDGNVLKVPSLKTIKDVIEHHLTDAPLGCMWQVEKGTTHYRKLGTGRMVFDGTYEGTIAKITLITPKGPFKSFKVTIGDEGNWLSQFSADLGQNKLKVLNVYARSIDGWDGIYMKDML